MSIVDSILKEPTMPHDGGTPASPRSPQPELAVPSSAADVTRGTGTVQDKQARGNHATRAAEGPAGRSHGGAGTQCRAMEVANWMTTDSVSLGEASSAPNGQPPQQQRHLNVTKLRSCQLLKKIQASEALVTP